MTGIQVLAVASEIYPLVKTGGLADVASALPRALRAEGVSAVTLVPGYPAVTAALRQSERVLAVDDLFGGSACALDARVGELDLFVLDAPHLFDRGHCRNLCPTGRNGTRIWPAGAAKTSVGGLATLRHRRRTARRRAFSAWSCFSRRTSFDCNPPNRLRQT
jgi:starch synthase